MAESSHIKAISGTIALLELMTAGLDFNDCWPGFPPCILRKCGRPIPLSELFRRREQLVRIKVAEKNRLANAPASIIGCFTSKNLKQ